MSYLPQPGQTSSAAPSAYSISESPNNSGVQVAGSSTAAQPGYAAPMAQSSVPYSSASSSSYSTALSDGSFSYHHSCK